MPAAILLLRNNEKEPQERRFRSCGSSFWAESVSSVDDIETT
jgi:hypothetical protein